MVNIFDTMFKLLILYLVLNVNVNLYLFYRAKIQGGERYGAWRNDKMWYAFVQINGSFNFPVSSVNQTITSEAVNAYSVEASRNFYYANSSNYNGFDMEILEFRYQDEIMDGKPRQFVENGTIVTEFYDGYLRRIEFF